MTMEEEILFARLDNKMPMSRGPIFRSDWDSRTWRRLTKGITPERPLTPWEQVDWFLANSDIEQKNTKNDYILAIKRLSNLGFEIGASRRPHFDIISPAHFKTEGTTFQEMGYSVRTFYFTNRQNLIVGDYGYCTDETIVQRVIGLVEIPSEIQDAFIKQTQTYEPDALPDWAKKKA